MVLLPEGLVDKKYKYNLHLTDKPLAEFLEVILFLKVFAVNWENNLMLN